jgi:3-deoxy-D-manno-octulosonate 8-phosphate phosphatase (KDO 8-P phosphatase)
MFKLLISDIDGVMTDGCKIYNREHNCICKRFCDLDFTAIEIFRDVLGIPVVLLTGDAFNLEMAKKRNIECYETVAHKLTSTKVSFLPKISTKYNIPTADIAYIGDDWYDVQMLLSVGHPYTVESAPSFMQRTFYAISKKGGEGVLADLLDMYLHTNDINLYDKAKSTITNSW